jgi:hypothetical protein
MRHRFAALLCAAALAALTAGEARALPINGTVNVRTTTVGPIGPILPDPGIANDLSFANRIYGQIGVSINHFSANNVHIQADPNGDGTWNGAEVALGATSLFQQNNNAGNAINLYYVPTYVSFGQAWAAEDVTAGFSIAVGAVMPTNTPVRRNDTFAHEIGHVLLDTWRFRTQEQFAGQSFHSKTGTDLMAAGGVPRLIPANLAAVFPTGARDEIGKNIGPRNMSATDTVPQISAMYYNNTFTSITAVDQITVEVEGASTSFNWGVEQTIGGLRVNEAARRLTVNTGKDDFLFHFRNTGGFGANAGGADDLLHLEMNDIASVDNPYLALLNGSFMVQVADDILNNPAAITTLTPIVDYTFSLTFNNLTNTIDFSTVNIDESVLNGKKDVFVMFTMIPEPSALWLFGAGAAALVALRRRRGAA